jgi:hypothetical protein
VKVITSLPADGGENFTLLTPHPGALLLPLVHSHGSSLKYPLAAPFPPYSSKPHLVLSVWYTLSGFVLLTSQTTTTPSCDPTANFVPSAEKEVEKDAAKEDEE